MFGKKDDDKLYGTDIWVSYEIYDIILFVNIFLCVINISLGPIQRSIQWRSLSYFFKNPNLIDLISISEYFFYKFPPCDLRNRSTIRLHVYLKMISLKFSKKQIICDIR
uniref:Uncharacterized protein n=1 Tax=Vespula pensylvanica TaxID=30213 RepID=A0A834KJ89_VESPE|nr:hypothetical protein H0235_013851 [Vespula pensylvanica]